MGEQILLVPDSCIERSGFSKNEKYDRLLRLCASEIADVRIADIPDNGVQDADNSATMRGELIKALVGAYSQSVIRGLPLDSVKTETANGTYECVTACGKVYLKYDKCKYLFTNLPKNHSDSTNFAGSDEWEIISYNGERYICVPICHSRVTSGDFSSQPRALTPDADTVIGVLEENT